MSRKHKKRVIGIDNLVGKMSTSSTDITPNLFLEDNFSDIYESITSINAPLISNRDFLRRTHRIMPLRNVDTILNFPHEEKERLLDLLVEYVLSLDVSNPASIVKAYDEIKKKLAHDSSVGKYFSNLTQSYESLSGREKIYVMKTALTKIKIKSDSIRLTICDQITKVKEPIELILLDQVFYLIREFSSISISKLDKPSKGVESRLSSILVWTIKLEAVRRGKLSMKDMTGDVAMGAISIEPKHIKIEKVAEPVLALLGE
jgi:hypothetical protein